jgi:hypothetical protein
MLHMILLRRRAMQNNMEKVNLTGTLGFHMFFGLYIRYCTYLSACNVQKYLYDDLCIGLRMETSVHHKPYLIHPTHTESVPCYYVQESRDPKMASPIPHFGFFGIRKCGCVAVPNVRFPTIVVIRRSEANLRFGPKHATAFSLHPYSVVDPISPGIAAEAAQAEC